MLLEWDYSKGDPPSPLVKDKYGSERRKVRTFSVKGWVEWTGRTVFAPTQNPAPYSPLAPNDQRIDQPINQPTKQAKTLNFSIAYGKTPFGLSKDWGVTTEEAQEMLDAWYADRPEVKKWQDQVI